MFLSDRDIKDCISAGEIVIDPYVEDNLQPASIDLTLDNIFKTVVETEGAFLDPRMPAEYDEVVIDGERTGFILPSGGFALASTVERIELCDHILGRLEGKSSLGRLGLTAHITAGFFDPGFRGYATLELFNASPLPIVLWPGMKICQLSFSCTFTAADKPYGHSDLNSKYQDQQRGPQGSEMHRNF